MCKIHNYPQEITLFNSNCYPNGCKVGDLSKFLAQMEARGSIYHIYQRYTQKSRQRQPKNLHIWKNKLSGAISGRCRVTFLELVMRSHSYVGLTLKPVEFYAQSLVSKVNLIVNYLHSGHLRSEIVRIIENSAIDCGNIQP